MSARILCFASVLAILALLGGCEPKATTAPTEPQIRPVTRAAPPRLPTGPAILQVLAGDGHAGHRNGAGEQARFSDPYGLAASSTGEVFVADGGESNTIRRIALDGTVSTWVGGAAEGLRDGRGTEAAFHTPSGLAFDAIGNLYVADTGNHAIRKITPDGLVSTLAGNGKPGWRDGPGAQAQFNGPLGVAVDAQGYVLVADSYNDRIRKVAPDGHVTTLAGAAQPGEQDGIGEQARFDTPTALLVDPQGQIWIADARNDAIRRMTPTGEVITVLRPADEDKEADLRRPTALALASEGQGVYVTVQHKGRVLLVKPDGQVQRITDGPQQRLARPSAIAVDAARGRLVVADMASRRVHALSIEGQPGAVGPAADAALPATESRWPLRPQNAWHEVVGTLGEVRGGNGESRHHLHAGLDVRGDVGETVYAIAAAKVTNPFASGGFGWLGEALSLDTLAYVHMRVGRDARGRPLDEQDTRFQFRHDERGKLSGVRVLRGTRFAAGDALGTINAMAHVHLGLGVPGYQRNALELGLQDFVDGQAPRIEEIALEDGEGKALKAQRGKVILSPGAGAELQIVVEAWDQVDGNLPRRRLGVQAVSYQLLDAKTRQPLSGFEAPRMALDFNRLPPDADDEAAKRLYSPSSGITVHGAKRTRFRLRLAAWPAAEIPAAGDYLLRVTVRDGSGNEAQRNLAITLN